MLSKRRESCLALHEMSPVVISRPFSLVSREKVAYSTRKRKPVSIGPFRKSPETRLFADTTLTGSIQSVLQ